MRRLIAVFLTLTCFLVTPSTAYATSIVSTSPTAGSILSTPVNCINPFARGKSISINFYLTTYLINFLLALVLFTLLREPLGELKVFLAYLDKNTNITKAKTINEITKISVVRFGVEVTT